MYWGKLPGSMQRRERKCFLWHLFLILSEQVNAIPTISRQFALKIPGDWISRVGFYLLSFQVYPEFGWNELFALVCFSVFELYLIWKGVWHKERLKQFGSLRLSFVWIYQDEKCYDVMREEEQTFMLYQSSFLRSIGMIRELYVSCPNISEVWYLKWEPKHILGGCRGYSMDMCMHTCITLVFCHEGGISIEQKEKKEISEQTILTYYWEPVASEQWIVWHLGEHVWEQEDTNGGWYWKAGSCLCLCREELDLREFILSKLLPWNIAMLICSMSYSS